MMMAKEETEGKILWEHCAARGLTHKQFPSAICGYPPQVVLLGSCPLSSGAISCDHQSGLPPDPHHPPSLSLSPSTSLLALTAKQIL